ncbi:hypothetical protein [Frankia gtarii]|uniref:hypothetical protein n=1 Tax=Frankia gtarii TaxID=2950102 RepID=UPI0021BEE1AC|nr:hypothetical protein [Frankia gtarii]
MSSHVGDVRGLHAERGEAVEEVAAVEAAGGERAESGVDEHDPVAGADQEAAERHLELAGGGEVLGVAGPVRLVAPGWGEDVARPHPGVAVPHGLNVQVTDLHRHSSGTSWVPCLQAGVAVLAVPAAVRCRRRRGGIRR